MIYGELDTLLKRVLSDMGLSPRGFTPTPMNIGVSSQGERGFTLERPEVAEHGDYATNAALVYGKQAGESPKELAEKIKKELESRGGSLIERAEVAGPGFLNMFLKPEVFTQALRDVLAQGDRYGENEALLHKQVMVEYTDANPFKEFHIGHLMTNTIGESLARVYESAGADVIRANFYGDVGLHVAKALWGMQKMETKTAADLGKAYALGAQEYEESESVKQEINELNKRVYDRSDEETNKLYDEGKKLSLAYFEMIYARLDTKFDEHYPESETGPIGAELVREYAKEHVFEESDGAIVFPGEKHGLHTRVFINSQGYPTYEAKDLGLMKKKFEDYPELFSSLSVTANEITDYFKVVLKAAEQINPLWAERTKHVPHGVMKLTGGKMSSRTGEVVAATTLLDDLKARALSRMGEKDEAVADQVAIAAIKYTILKQAPGRDIIFNPDESISFEGDTGPYLQYTHARIKSILGKSEVEPYLETAEEVGELERLIAAYPEAVARAYEERAPNKVANYLAALAQAFNTYYAEKKIADNPYRLALASATAQTIKNGLNLLGISAPERM